MDRLTGANPFIDEFICDPYKQLVADINAAATHCFEPFTVVNTQDGAMQNTTTNIFSTAPKQAPLFDRPNVSLGEFGFSLHSKISTSAREGVDVFAAHDHKGDKVAVKRYALRSPLLTPQITGPHNKSNLLQLLKLNIPDPLTVVATTELCNFNLKTFLLSDAYKNGGLSLRRRLCFEFICGMHALHSSNMVHGNLKPENVLIGTDGILKLGDYPMMSQWDNLLKQLPCGNSERLCWEATEVKKRMTCSSAHKSDLQVGGMLLYFLLCEGAHPFGPLTSPITVDSNIRAGQFLVDTGDMMADHLVSWLVQAEPRLRKDTNVCLTHPFFWNKKKQVEFMAAVGRQPEIRSGFKTPVSSQINEVALWLNIPDWRNRIDAEILRIMGNVSADNQYDKSMGQLLKLVYDLQNVTDMSDRLSTITGDLDEYITERFTCCVLPIYNIVIKSALCLRPSIEKVLQLSIKPASL